MVLLVVLGSVAQDDEFLILLEDGSLEQNSEAELDAGQVRVGVWQVFVCLLLTVGPEVGSVNVDVARILGDGFASELEIGVSEALVRLRK